MQHDQVVRLLDSSADCLSALWPQPAVFAAHQSPNSTKVVNGIVFEKKSSTRTAMALYFAIDRSLFKQEKQLCVGPLLLGMGLDARHQLLARGKKLRKQKAKLN